MTNPYTKLAIKIAKDIHSVAHSLDKEHYDYFAKYFRPTRKEQLQYDHWRHNWTSKIFASHQYNNEFRIMALLFCAELWEDEQREDESTYTYIRYK